MRSEFDLIGLLRDRIAAAGATDGDRVVVGSGDDAAITAPHGRTATSVDAIVDGVHFKRATFPPDAIGHKALAVALSDLAAMGAEPGEAYVQLGLPDDMSERQSSRASRTDSAPSPAKRESRSPGATWWPRQCCFWRSPSWAMKPRTRSW